MSQKKGWYARWNASRYRDGVYMMIFLVFAFYNLYLAFQLQQALAFAY
jgi:hypothetical protein